LSLLCHAATAAQRQGRFPRDEPAETAALEGMRSLRETLGRTASVSVSAAPELRAHQTAAMLGSTISQDPMLCDLDLGRWVGRALTEIHESEPDGAAAWLTDPEWKGHGGESIQALISRADAWLKTQARRSGHRICVTHAAFIRSVVIGVLDAPAAAFWRLDIEPLSVTQLHWNGKNWSLRALGVRMEQL
jgi:broad specificity phosphatase PhoE